MPIKQNATQQRMSQQQQQQKKIKYIDTNKNGKQHTKIYRMQQTLLKGKVTVIQVYLKKQKKKES